MQQLGQLQELRLENNTIERFNVQLSLMPNLHTVSFDWFAYVHLEPIQYRREDCDDIDSEHPCGFSKLEALMDTDSCVDFIKFIRFFGCANINQVDKQGRTLLHTAAQRGDV